ncbi:MAG: GreA/GreB family elongation factor [Clostridiaceae bacterium]|nr:GreA/GreB family elongation factor [Clostridiaceae bacterium]
MSTVLSKAVFEMLVKHLVEIEEEKEQILGKYYPDTTEERELFIDLIDNYIGKIEEFIYKAKVKKDAEEACPFVIIGSTVEIEDMHCNEIERYKIISPFESNSNVNIDLASYLSPMGKALLLKKVNDIVLVETPMGQFTYIVRSIKLPREMYV